MKTPPWTPGPWLADESDVWAEAAIGGNVVCLSPDEDCPESRAYWPANARLIAASPTLAEALASLAWAADQWGEGIRIVPYIDAARAALSAAGWPEGGES